MSDYKGIFAQEDFVEPNDSCKKTFLVRLMHRKTKNISWTGTVEALTSKDAQAQWRKEYADIRPQYDHSYCLVISHLMH